MVIESAHIVFYHSNFGTNPTNDSQNNIDNYNCEIKGAHIYELNSVPESQHSTSGCYAQPLLYLTEVHGITQKMTLHTTR